MRKKNVLLKDSGIKKIEFNLKKINYLKGNSLFDNENLEAYQIVNQSLKARFIYERDKDYIVKDGQIIVIDEFSGRLAQEEGSEKGYINHRGKRKCKNPSRKYHFG